VKRWRIHFKSKAGDQYVTLMARDRGEAELLAGAYQARRAGRYQVTMENLESGLGHFGGMDEKQSKAERERRERDFSRYDIVTQKEIAKDENGNPIYVDETGAAEAPFKIAKIEEVK
jgi:hypothetical protein